MKKLLIATQNTYKREQFIFLFREYAVEVVTLRDIGGEYDVEETGVTARENAALKARYWAQESGLITLADDAGLEIDALGGEPGLQARRWNGLFPDDVDDEVWLEYVLGRLQGVSLEKRTARWNAAWVVVDPAGQEIVRDINLEFLITEDPVRPYTPGSPLSAVRWYPEYEEVETRLSPHQQWAPLIKEVRDWRELHTMLGVEVS